MLRNFDSAAPPVAEQRTRLTLCSCKDKRNWRSSEARCPLPVREESQRHRGWQVPVPWGGSPWTKARMVHGPDGDRNKFGAKASLNEPIPMVLDLTPLIKLRYILPASRDQPLVFLP